MSKNIKKHNVRSFKAMKEQNEKIVMLTSYDAVTAKIAAAANIDILLVGDSVGNAVLGFDSTIPVTIGMMKHHAKMVRRGAPKTFIVVDMPFMSVQISDTEALRDAAALMQETGCDAVKIEGADNLELIAKMIRGGIPVMGHLGLLPQQLKAEGGFFIKGKSQQEADKLLSDALALERTGIFALVVECVPEKVAKNLADHLSIPVIGIGSGQSCDGQVQVVNDILGLDADFTPKHSKKYIDLYNMVKDVFNTYCDEVKKNKFK